jgi:hypothetical protein
MWFFFEWAEEFPRPLQAMSKLSSRKNKSRPVARLGVLGACQRWMFVSAPFVKTEQNRPSESTICPK